MKNNKLVREFKLNCGVTILNDEAIDDSKILVIINELLYWYSKDLKDEELYLKESFLNLIKTKIVIDGEQKMLFEKGDERFPDCNFIMMRDNRFNSNNVKDGDVSDLLGVYVQNPYELYLQYKKIYDKE